MAIAAPEDLALKDISFEVQPGEAVALVGRSGCGKSTLLHILSGLMTPSAGEVRIDDALVGPLASLDRHVPATAPLSVDDRPAKRRPRFKICAPPATRDRVPRVDQLLQLVELEGYAARNVQDLSGGQQQRVALARSLAVRPDVLLLDEPFSALDSVTRRALQRDVRQIAIEIGITVVIVTHDIPEAVAMADRAIVMRSNPGAIAEIVPIKIDRHDRDHRGAGAQAAQSSLQTAFERASVRMIEPLRQGDQDALRIVATGYR